LKELIYNNLKNEITKDIENKLQVVYILVQIRKLLELENKKRTFPILNLFCNWVLHPKLCEDSTKRVFENQVEPCIDKNWDYETIKIKLKAMSSFFDLSELKKEISKFLSVYDSTNNSIKTWKSFMKYLLEVLEECPVEYNGSKIKSLSITNSKDAPIFRIHLKFKTIDGKNVIKVKLKGL
jgi:hypothetical protein